MKNIRSILSALALFLMIFANSSAFSGDTHSGTIDLSNHKTDKWYPVAFDYVSGTHLSHDFRIFGSGGQNEVFDFKGKFDIDGWDSGGRWGYEYKESGYQNWNVPHFVSHVLYSHRGNSVIVYLKGGRSYDFQSNNTLVKDHQIGDDFSIDRNNLELSCDIKSGSDSLPRCVGFSEDIKIPSIVRIHAVKPNTQFWDRDIGSIVSLGYDINKNTIPGDNSIALGRGIIAAGNNAAAIGYYTTASGHSSNAMGHSTTASSPYSTAMGYNTIAASSYSTAIGGNTTASGHSSTAMGLGTTASGHSSTAMGLGTTASGHSSTVIGQHGKTHNNDVFSVQWGSQGAGQSDNAIFKVQNNGNVGIGTTTPSQTLSVNGSAGKSNGGSWSNFSDKRIKKDIQTYTKGLQEILQIRPITFRYNKKSPFNDASKQVGIIAQEIQKVLPQTVKKIKTEHFDDLLEFNSSELTFTLINAVKEQQSQIEQQQSQIKNLQKAIEQLKNE